MIDSAMNSTVADPLSLGCEVIGLGGCGQWHGTGHKTKDRQLVINRDRDELSVSVTVDAHTGGIGVWNGIGE